MIRATLLALLLAGVATAPAQAGAVDDAKRLTRLYMANDRGVQARTDAFEREFDAELEACAAQPPGDVLGTRLVSLHLRGALARSAAQLDRLAGRLKRLRTSDRTLRGLASAIAHTTALAVELGESPPRPCPYFEAWRAAGWTEDFRISPPVRNFTATEVASLRRDARTVRRAVPRLRRLGISLRVRREIREGFTGDALYAELAL